MKSTRGQSFKMQMQKGFTLVELAIVLVIAGIILVGVLKGTDAINKAKVERMVSDMRGLQGILLEYQKRNGRTAGDCDNNGVVETALALTPTLLNTFAGTVGTAAILDQTEANRVMVSPAVNGAAIANTVCIAPTSTEATVNQVWNELRRAGVVDANRLPRELARHQMNDVFLVGTMSDLTNRAGVIVAYGVPVWMAEAIEASIDGGATTYGGAVIGGPANTGRVRLWAGAATPMAAGVLASAPNLFTAAAGTGSYDEGASDRDRLIAISFQYTPEKLVN